MDRTREGDLSKLHKVLNDPLLPIGQRQRAHRSFESILRQMKDKTVNRLRYRLAKATIAGDSESVENITMLLEDYSMRRGY